MATHTGAIILGLTPFFVVPKAKELGDAAGRGVGLGLIIGVLVPWEIGVSVNEGTGVLVDEGMGVLVDEGTGVLVNGVLLEPKMSGMGILVPNCSIPLSGRDLDIVFVARPATTGFGIAVDGVLVRQFKIVTYSSLPFESHLRGFTKGYLCYSDWVLEL